MAITMDNDGDMAGSNPNIRLGLTLGLARLFKLHKLQTNHSTERASKGLESSFPLPPPSRLAKLLPNCFPALPSTLNKLNKVVSSNRPFVFPLTHSLSLTPTEAAPILRSQRIFTRPPLTPNPKSSKP